MSEIIVDNFAGGGGASTGIELAGHRVHEAINHNPQALAMHLANHPDAYVRNRLQKLNKKLESVVTERDKLHNKLESLIHQLQYMMGYLREP